MDADSYSVRSQFRGLGWPLQAAWLLRENFVSRIQRNSNAAVQMPGWPRPEGVPVSAEEQGAGLQRSEEHPGKIPRHRSKSASPQDQ